jgi:hypothetical protein
VGQQSHRREERSSYSFVGSATATATATATAVVVIPREEVPADDAIDERAMQSPHPPRVGGDPSEYRTIPNDDVDVDVDVAAAPRTTIVIAVVVVVVVAVAVVVLVDVVREVHAAGAVRSGRVGSVRFR